MSPSPEYEVGSQVEYVGPDLPEVQVWHGHPGRIVDVPPLEPCEVAVDLVGGPAFCFPVPEVRILDDKTYRLRGERIIAGTHPTADREVGEPVTATGSHWA